MNELTVRWSISVVGAVLTISVERNSEMKQNQTESEKTWIGWLWRWDKTISYSCVEREKRGVESLKLEWIQARKFFSSSLLKQISEYNNVETYKT